MVGIYALDCGWPFLSDVNLLVIVLGRRDDQFLCVVLEDKRGIFGIFVSLTPDHTEGDDAHDPDHPQKNTNAASWYMNMYEWGPYNESLHLHIPITKATARPSQGPRAMRAWWIRLKNDLSWCLK